MERNFKLTVCYDGTRYRGWQRQGNTPDTIQAKLETLLSRLLEQPVEVQGSGRTDAGVHAAGQVASFRADTEMSCARLLPEIRDAVGDQLLLIADGGMESGYDAFKALALGADLVTVGRPLMGPLKEKGPAGVREVLETTAGCTVCCHCGPDTLGILFMRKSKD